jgi:hypothetical protein
MSRLEVGMPRFFAAALVVAAAGLALAGCAAPGASMSPYAASPRYDPGGASDCGIYGNCNSYGRQFEPYEFSNSGY